MKKPLLMVVAASLALTGATACQKKDGYKASSKDEMSAMGTMDAMKDERSAMNRPARRTAPRPAMDARPTAAVDPAVVKTIQDVATTMAGKDWKARSAARKAFRAMLKAHKKDTALANLLLKQTKGNIAEEGVFIWERVKKEQTDPFIAAMKGAFGHPSDKVRYRAVNAFWFGVDKKKREGIAPDARKLLSDASCLVARKAHEILYSILRDQKQVDEQKKLVLTGLHTTRCPSLQAWAADELRSLHLKALGAKETTLLRKMATTSPYFMLRCQAVRALATMKDKQAERLAGALFKQAAETALVVYFKDGQSPFTFNVIARNLAECAARAVAVLKGERPHVRESKKVIATWKALAAKRLAPRVPARTCITKSDCAKGTFCVSYSCQTPKQAEKAYWTYAKLDRCYRKNQKRNRPKNFASPPRVKAGFGSHWMAEWDLRKIYEKANLKTFRAKQTKIWKETKCK